MTTTQQEEIERGVTKTMNGIRRTMATLDRQSEREGYEERVAYITKLYEALLVEGMELWRGAAP